LPGGIVTIAQHSPVEAGFFHEAIHDVVFKKVIRAVFVLQGGGPSGGVVLEAPDVARRVDAIESFFISFFSKITLWMNLSCARKIV
jgi:hypothetical protein